MRDNANNLDFRRAFSPAAAVTDGTAQVSQVCDRKGFDSLVLAIQTGTLSDADATWSVLIEDSADNSNWSAVADDFLNGTEALAGFQFDDDNECRKIGYTGGKRYVRATIDDVTANSGNLFLAGMWVLGHKKRLPTANPPA